jgi:hypothetical protein
MTERANSIVLRGQGLRLLFMAQSIRLTPCEINLSKSPRSGIHGLQKAFTDDRKAISVD